MKERKGELLQRERESREWEEGEDTRERRKGRKDEERWRKDRKLGRTRPLKLGIFSVIIMIMPLLH